MSRATINDVAREANVSKKTVSRVLNQEPNVHLDTRQRVLDAMNKLSYRPSKQARGLASTQSYLVALIYDNPNKSYISDIQEGCLSVCNEFGYHLLIHPSDYDAEDRTQRLHDLIVDSQVDGVILTPPFSDNEEILTLIEELNRPCVRVGGTYHKENTPFVTANDRTISMELTNYLVSLGHTRIGYIKGHPDHSASELRFEGYLKALEQNNIAVDDDIILQGLFQFRQAESVCRKMLRMDDPPTAIFASNDQMAAAVLKVASQSGFEVPHDLSVCGFDDAPISNYIWPSLTTIKQPLKTIARDACQHLLRGIKNQQSLDDVIHQCEVIIRASTAPPSRRV